MAANLVHLGVERSPDLTGHQFTDFGRTMREYRPVRMQHGADQGCTHSGPILDAKRNDLRQAIPEDTVGELVEMHHAWALDELIDQCLAVHTEAGCLTQQTFRGSERALVLGLTEDQTGIAGELGEDLEVGRGT